jgi:hypothetical protein
MKVRKKMKNNAFSTVSYQTKYLIMRECLMPKSAGAASLYDMNANALMNAPSMVQGRKWDAIPIALFPFENFRQYSRIVCTPFTFLFSFRFFN